MNKEMLTEQVFETPIAILEESDKDTKKLMKISGIAGKAGIVNRNKRFYSNISYTKAVERAQRKIQSNKFLGEVDHPQYGGGSLKRSAIRFTKLEMDGDTMLFEAVVLPTPDGQILEGLIRGGVGIGVSTRGYASVKYDKIGDEEVVVIGDDLEFDGIDVVLEESNPFGRVTNYESRGGKIEMKTIEEFKAQFPELAQAFEESVKANVLESVTNEARHELEKEFDTRLAQAVEEQKATVRQEIMESEEIVGLKNTINAVVSALGEHVQTAPVNVDESVQKANAEVLTLTESVNDLTAKLAVAEGKVSAYEAEKAEAERKVQIAEAIDKALEGERFATQIRTQLAECKTVEEVESKVASAKSLVESIMKAQGIDVAGAGQAPNKDEDHAPVNEDVERQKRLAGIL